MAAPSFSAFDLDCDVQSRECAPGYRYHLLSEGLLPVGDDFMKACFLKYWPTLSTEDAMKNATTFCLSPRMAEYISMVIHAPNTTVRSSSLLLSNFSALITLCIFFAFLIPSRSLSVLSFLLSFCLHFPPFCFHWTPLPSILSVFQPFVAHHCCGMAVGVVLLLCVCLICLFVFLLSFFVPFLWLSILLISQLLKNDDDFCGYYFMPYAWFSSFLGNSEVSLLTSLSSTGMINPLQQTRSVHLCLHFPF